MAICVLVHATGVSEAVRYVRHNPVRGEPLGAWTWLSVQLAGWVVALHLVEIAVWAVAYVWSGALPDLPSALYFSAVTYTTTGYGDIVLPPQYRLVGGVEALTGILMCGWSTGFFFATVSRMFEVRTK